MQKIGSGELPSSVTRGNASHTTKTSPTTKAMPSYSNVDNDCKLTTSLCNGRKHNQARAVALYSNTIALQDQTAQPNSWFLQHVHVQPALYCNLSCQLQVPQLTGKLCALKSEMLNSMTLHHFKTNSIVLQSQLREPSLCQESSIKGSTCCSNRKKPSANRSPK